MESCSPSCHHRGNVKPLQTASPTPLNPNKERERVSAEVSIVLLETGTLSTSLILSCAHVVLPSPSQYACERVSQKVTAAPVHPHYEGPGAHTLSYAPARYSTCIVREGQQVGSDANEETLEG